MDDSERRTAAKKRFQNRKIAFIAVSVCSGIFLGVSLIHDVVHDTKETIKAIGKDVSEQINQNIEPVGEAFGELSEKVPSLFEEIEEEMPSMTDSMEDISLLSESDNSYEDTFSSVDSEILNSSKGTVIQVIDGESLLININGKETRIRLIGIDVPEKIVPSDYSSEERNIDEDITTILKKKISEGDVVSLEYDNSPTDKYGRILAYVYFSDGKMIQDYLLENGYSTLIDMGENKKYSEHFKEIALKAQKEKIGLWNGYFSAMMDVKDYE